MKSVSKCILALFFLTCASSTKAQLSEITFTALEQVQITESKGAVIKTETLEPCKTKITFHAEKYFFIAMPYYQSLTKSASDTFVIVKKVKTEVPNNDVFYYQYNCYGKQPQEYVLDVYYRKSSNKMIGAMFYNGESGLMFLNGK